MNDTTSSTPPRWPERAMNFVYQSGSRVIAWSMLSACSTCGADLRAHGFAELDVPFTQSVQCDHCGASFTVDGQIVS